MKAFWGLCSHTVLSHFFFCKSGFVLLFCYIYLMCVILFNFSSSVIIKISSFSAVFLSLWHILFLCRLSVYMRVQVMLHVCVLRAGRVMAECVWRSTTVCWRVEEAAAPTRTVNTSDPDRSVLKICDRINFELCSLWIFSSIFWFLYSGIEAQYKSWAKTNQRSLVYMLTTLCKSCKYENSPLYMQK